MSNKKYIIGAIVIIVLLVIFGVYNFTSQNGQKPEASITATPSVSESASPTPSSLPSKTQNPQSTEGWSQSTKLWQILKGPAYCELKGEIKFVSSNIYDNQDALFIYRGVDHPGRLINWTITPSDDLDIGPNLFAQMNLPDGQSLIGVVLPQNPKYKRYELTAQITYGRQINDNIEVYTQSCVGKTTVILP